MHLLIVSCSQSKNGTAGTLPAIERYDGPTFRTLRSLRRTGMLPPSLDIYIVSGKFGVVRWDEPLPYYDQRLEPSSDIASDAKNDMAKLLERPYEEVFVNMGKEYLSVFGDILASAKKAEGRIGEKTSHMKRWICSLQ
jgi:hypothetical protein